MGRPRTWTDDDLRAAVAASSTLAEVVAHLGLRRGGGAYAAVRTRIEQLQLDVDHLGDSGRVLRDRRSGRLWTHDDLEEAVARGRSLNEVFTLLGLKVGGSQWAAVRGVIREAGWSTAHWIHPLGTMESAAGAFSRVLAGTEDLDEIVAQARSHADVIRSLGHEPTSTRYRTLARHLEMRGISADHFEPRHVAMRRAKRPRYRIPLEKILVRDSTYSSTEVLKARLIEEGVLEPRCARCGIAEWLDEPLVLHLDHISGDRRDHRLENLRLLCPNCHSQTSTYAGRNMGRYAATG